MKIALTQFQGANQAIQPRLLNPAVGVSSLNQKPGRGDLRPWKNALSVYSNGSMSGRGTIYRMGRDVASDANYWLSWTGIVNAVRGFDADDTTERTYFTGNGQPQWTDNILALSSAPYPTATRLWGVPAPTSAPTITTDAAPTVTAGAFVVGNTYTIATVGTTDYTLIGASANTVGIKFVATGVGSGTGTATYVPTGSTQYLYYVYTYVNDRGEESAPSPYNATANTRKTDQTATISGFVTPPSNYGINRIRVYRTQTSSSGSADFYFLRELGTSATVAATTTTAGNVYTIVTVGTTDYTLIGALSNTVGLEFTATAAGTGTGTVSYFTASTSNTTDDNRTLGETLETKAWLPPPGTPTGGAVNLTEPTLSGLTAMWNGMMAGISGNSVRVCESFIPYAWPIAYQVIPPTGKPVGVGVFGQQMLVLTTGRPLLVSGSSPDSLDQMPLEMPQGCVSAKSIVGMGSGVAWSSNDGLCWYGAGGPKIITAGIMTREDWQALTPSSIVGRMYEGLYFGYYSGSGGGGFVIDPANPTGIYFLGTGYPVSHFDELQDQLYVYSGTAVYRWDADSTFMTSTFKSKIFQMPKPVQAWGCIQVYASSYPATVSIDAVELPSGDVTKIVATRPSTFTAPTSTTVRQTVVVSNSNPVRLAGGFFADNWQIQVATGGNVQAVTLAHSIAELKEA